MPKAGERLIRSAHEAAAEVRLQLDPDALLVALSAHVDEHFGPMCTVPDMNCMGCQMWDALRTLRLGLDEAGAFDTEEKS